MEPLTSCALRLVLFPLALGLLCRAAIGQVIQSSPDAAGTCAADGTCNERSTSGCPAFDFDHLFKAGGNTVNRLLAVVFPRANDMWMASGIHVNLTSKGLLSWSEFRGKDAPVFKVGMARSPCEYLLSAWAFQRTPGHDTPEKTGCHGGGICNCLKRHAPKGVSYLEYLPVMNKSYKAKPDEPWRVAEGEITEEVMREDAQRFSKFLRLMSGKKVHFETLRFFHLMNKKGVGIDQDCPASLSEKNEAKIIKAIKRESEQHLHYKCLIRTETMHADIQNCSRVWAHSCSHAPTSKALLEHLDRIFASKNWEAERHTRSNTGWHGRCQDFISKQDQEFIWEREQILAESAGFEACCAGTR